MSFRPPPKTSGGYSLDEVASAYQKSVRRGLEYQAVFFAREMLRSGFGSYAWRRCFVICAEDVGIGSPDAIGRVMDCYTAALAYLGKRTPKGTEWPRAGLFLCMATVILCRSNKSRMLADLSYVCARRYEKGERLEIPAYALDAHTARGRAHGVRWNTRAGIALWQRDGRLINPDVTAVVDGGKWRAEIDELWRQEKFPDDSPEIVDDDDA